VLEEIDNRLAHAKRLWLFLDYDGTLAGFAPTPDQVDPDPEVIALLSMLAAQPNFRVAIVSGRCLGHIETLAPVPGIFLAGTYGIELRTPKGERINRVEHETIRPLLEPIKPQWEHLIAGREGFFLEDKDWALALHARFATDEEANQVLTHARSLASQVVSSGPLRLLGGHKFLEIGPRLANKGETVGYLLDRYDWEGALPLYIGDDDKDEEAFQVIKERSGIAIVVAQMPRSTAADGRLPSPQAVRHWLGTLPSLIDGGR
jgi:trehalose 6-phosphate phosphatase